ncbi:TadE/TadG family type IV pilus assembly protein [Sphingomonas sp. ac-8]|uniref:TadE/TadG family type IV pilus assembly protein n=1 Tax=Sphingomonas sp. ac-8 TaxID=3242977 RepID=UPI003A81063D
MEFALVVPLLLTILMATLELGYQGYVNAMVQGAMTKAARMSTIGDQTQAGVTEKIKTEVGRVVDRRYVSVETRGYYNFSNVGRPEKITQDTDPKGKYNKGDCYEDANNNGKYDVSAGTSDLGTADDVTYYKVTANYPNLTPIAGFLKWAGKRNVTATIVLRNQPFTSRASTTIRCD